MMFKAAGGALRLLEGQEPALEREFGVLSSLRLSSGSRAPRKEVYGAGCPGSRCFGSDMAASESPACAGYDNHLHPGVLCGSSRGANREKARS